MKRMPSLASRFKCGVGITDSVKINGQTVNECFDVKPTAGKILLQNEGYEVFFRRFELRPLK